MKGILLTYALILTVFVPARSQTAKAYDAAAALSFESNDFYSAMKYYEQSLQVEPGRPTILYRYAESARHFGALLVAEKTYAYLAGQDAQAQFPDLNYWLADVKKSLGKYDEAIRFYQGFLAQKTGDGVLRHRAVEEIDVCEWALEEINDPDVTMLIERMPGAINSPNSEFGTFRYKNETYFSSFQNIPWGDKHLPERPLLRIMKMDLGTSNPIALFNAANKHTAHLNFSKDGQLAVFNYCEYTGETDIQCTLYYSAFDGAVWSDPLPLPEPVNMPGYTSTQPHIAQKVDGQYLLYFVSDRPDGVGGMDMWQTWITNTGEASAPQNIRLLNTPDDELTPYFFAPENTLYFSSTGYPTLGGFDVYKSRLEKGNWSDPEHLSIPVNSSFNDIYYAPQEDNWAFFSSNRVGSSNIDEDACCYDVYKATILPVNLETMAYSEMTGQALDGVVFSLIEPEKPSYTRFVNEGNTTSWEVQKNKEYAVVAHKEGYLPDTVTLLTQRIPADRRYMKKLFLKPNITLAVQTYNQLSEEPLAGVSVRLIEVRGRSEDQVIESGSGGSVLVDFKKQYMLVAEKEGYYPDTLMVTEEELRSMEPGAKLDRNFFMTPASLAGYLPLSLYFDNDQPKPGRRVQSYDQAVSEYLTQKEKFLATFTAGMDSVEQQGAIERLDRFFSEDVEGGYLKLEYFAENLDLFLENGYEVTILVKGFASPLANSEYNLALTKRRIASVKSYFRKYENGVYAAYISNGQLQIQSAPLGELEAPEAVSDDYRNKRMSVYSLEASRERRTEIIEVNLSKN
jgi:hypothetical protein